MKTKLLRKVRKRFVIEYNPRGVEFFDDLGRVKNYKETYVVWDKNCLWDLHGCYSKGECLDWIVNQLRKQYPELGSFRKKKLKNKKIWYV